MHLIPAPSVTLSRCAPFQPVLFGRSRSQPRAHRAPKGSIPSAPARGSLPAAGASPCRSRGSKPSCEQSVPGRQRADISSQPCPRSSTPHPPTRIARGGSHSALIQEFPLSSRAVARSWVSTLQQTFGFNGVILFPLAAESWWLFFRCSSQMFRFKVQPRVLQKGRDFFSSADLKQQDNECTCTINTTNIWLP